MEIPEGGKYVYDLRSTYRIEPKLSVFSIQYTFQIFTNE